ncbi:hypothetical protein [Bacteroides sp.]|uniref:hypothetical protein n=1 Tax=Bacteroides sp. TaxID=29523 RepID=UPI002584B73C|nr:hypothetical protein [Bacteroides sp.]
MMMSNRMTFFAFFVFISCLSFGQNSFLIKEMEANDLQIRQKTNTESLLRAYIMLSNDTIKEDEIVYALIYAPMNCPRCEVAIPAFQKLLKKNDSKNKLLLITVYDNLELARAYNIKHNYDADFYLYDTNDLYKDIFSFNSNGMFGLYLLKINLSQGRLMTGGQYIVLDKKFINELVDYEGIMDAHNYEQNEDIDEDEIDYPVRDQELSYTDHYIQEEKEFLISSVYGKITYDNDYLIFTDVLSNGAMVFHKDEKKDALVFNSFIEADSLEKRKFITIPDELFQEEIKKGFVFYIACESQLRDGEILSIAYSLPYIEIEKEVDGVKHLGFYNSPAIINRNLVSNSKEEMYSYNINIFEESFFYTHYNFSSIKNCIAVGTRKLTWPIEFEAEDYMFDMERNPFNPLFYTYKNPYITLFDKNGDVLLRFGDLEACHEKSLTGYYYTNPLVVYNKNRVVYTDGYSGKIYDASYNEDKIIPDKFYTIYNVDIENFPEPDSTKFYTQEYIKPYNKFFYRRVEALEVTDDYIGCLVKYSLSSEIDFKKDQYSFISINRKNDEISTFHLPLYLDKRVIGYGLTKNEGKIKPFILVKDNKSFLRIYNCN